MNKHTPGPWRVSTPDHTSGATMIQAADGTIICSRVMAHDGSNDDIEAAEANARLVAAAPELLEALELAKLAVENAIRLCRRHDDNAFIGHAFTLDNINSAIGKAKGEA